MVPNLIEKNILCILITSYTFLLQPTKEQKTPIKEDKATINWYKEQLKQVNMVAKVLRTECENLKEQQVSDI